jgi:hypothetical protein
MLSLTSLQIGQALASAIAFTIPSPGWPWYYFLGHSGLLSASSETFHRFMALFQIFAAVNNLLSSSSPHSTVFPSASWIFVAKKACGAGRWYSPMDNFL